MRRLKQLEDENAKLKKIVADLSLDRETLQDVIRRKHHSTFSKNRHGRFRESDLLRKRPLRVATVDVAVGGQRI
jgi:hypothetical protein